MTLKAWFYIALAIACAVAIAYFWDAAGDAREGKITAAAVKVERQLEEAKDEIRSNRPDRGAVIDSLQRGEF